VSVLPGCGAGCVAGEVAEWLVEPRVLSNLQAGFGTPSEFEHHGTYRITLVESNFSQSDSPRQELNRIIRGFFIRKNQCLSPICPLHPPRHHPPNVDELTEDEAKRMFGADGEAEDAAASTTASPKPAGRRARLVAILITPCWLNCSVPRSIAARAATAPQGESFLLSEALNSTHGSVCLDIGISILPDRLVTFD
jgi:hypothetical protein